ncbi:SAM-dependent methyltransferase [Spirillospora sp. NPDC127200]
MPELWQHEIAEGGHRILNPLSEDKLRLLEEVVRTGPGLRMLDLACGKGEMLGRWAAGGDVSGVGVDISEVFLAAARERAAELGVAGRVEFVHGDAGRYRARERFDVVSCIGATWIGGGLAGTLELMRSAATPDGLLLVGEVFWNEDPPEAAYEALGLGRGDFATLAGTLERFEAAGVELVEMVLAGADDWDRYMASQWWTVHQWLKAHPDDPRAPEMRRFADQARRSHLAYGRRYLGWGVFVLRPEPA